MAPLTRYGTQFRLARALLDRPARARLSEDMKSLVPAGRPEALVVLADTAVPEPQPGEALRSPEGCRDVP